jgi:hypothetical protein
LEGVFELVKKQGMGDQKARLPQVQVINSTPKMPTPVDYTYLLIKEKS